MTMRKWFVAVILITIIGAASFLALSGAKDEGAHPLSEYGMADKDVYETVAFLESTLFEPGEMQAGLNAETLTVSTDVGSASYDMPDEAFYASIAPYYDSTHPCGDHNLVTCRGELDRETFDVTVTNSEGDIVFDETVESETNGFFGIWLPRNIDGSITLEHEGNVLEGDITTFSDSGTCFTDYRFE